MLSKCSIFGSLFSFFCRSTAGSWRLIHQTSVFLFSTTLSFLSERITQFFNIYQSSSSIHIVDLVLAGQRSDTGSYLNSIFAKIFNVIFHDVLITYFTWMNLTSVASLIFNYIQAFVRFSSISFEDRNRFIIEWEVHNISIAQWGDLFI